MNTSVQTAAGRPLTNRNAKFIKKQHIELYLCGRR